MLKWIILFAALALAVATTPAHSAAAALTEIEIQPLPLGAFKPSTNINARVLAASTAETITFPTGCSFVYFASDGDFYARWDGSTATIAAADITDGTASEINPTTRYVVGFSTVSVIAPVATVITYVCYKWTR